MKSLITLIALLSTVTFAHAGRVYIHKEFGEYYYDGKGMKGVVLCFHGSGGNGGAWSKKSENKNFLRDLKRNGYSYLCPTSKNRSVKKWNANNTKRNGDVRNVDNLLKHLKLTRKNLFLVGHSNGGGFVSRYALLSKYGYKIKAIQHSNSSGLLQAMENRNYRISTLFAYASCDFVPVNKVMKNFNYLTRKLGPSRVDALSLDFQYRLRRSRSCHEFLNVSRKTIQFFNKSIAKSRR